MGAAVALQEALVGRLVQHPEFTGVYHDAPARAPFPYVVLVCDDEKDWSFKGREGREILLSLVIWDDEPARLLDLEEVVETELARATSSGRWHLSTFVQVGKRRSRSPGGPESSRIEMRARLIEVDEGEGS